MTTWLIEIARRPAEPDVAWLEPGGLEMARHCIEFVGGRMITGEVVSAPFDLVISAELPVAAHGWLEALIADASGPWLAYRTTRLDDNVVDLDPPVNLDPVFNLDGSASASPSGAVGHLVSPGS
jgi:hypothetical protein